MGNPGHRPSVSPSSYLLHSSKSRNFTEPSRRRSKSKTPVERVALHPHATTHADCCARSSKAEGRQIGCTRELYSTGSSS